ncbi:hypothetical protein [Photobacterium profundum]|uniref:Uncharacterized protein n=1 Tax=Photobacterium profundum (strain SS9) TaxID=298386 RepID=Q6LJV2_PHOPR|nr:hypothetical protein [Photobacterium profundum]CAG22428.1 hypothetical protein PBPRB0555 [Photobacterium profundum SS9]
MEETQRRIAFAWYLEGWKYEGGSRPRLFVDGERIKPTEYENRMHHHLFCPVCFTNLSRVPIDADSDTTTASMEAHYRHLPSYSAIPCDLRSVQTSGKKYTSTESVTQAIDNEELVIVSRFMQDRPVQAIVGQPRPFDEAQIEDEDGPETNVPLGIHDGDSFTVPSKITSLRGICRNFGRNYYRYYFLPGYQHAIALTSLLHDARDVTETDNKPKLYFVKLRGSTHHGNPPGGSNIRMTYIERSSSVVDFCIKTQHWLQHEHGIGDDSNGRYALVYGKITKNGIGLCFEHLGWGELSLVPERYNYLIEDIYAAAHAE